MVFAVILQPLKKTIQKHVVESNGISSFLTLLSGILIVVIPLALMSVVVIHETQSAYTSLATGSTGLTTERITLNIGTWLEPYFPGSTNLASSVSTEINNYIAQSLETHSRVWLPFYCAPLFSS
jgi:predicted PurR-regulated permease PerM